MKENMLKLAYLGGFGAMASPAAKHLSADGPAQVIRVHDRGKVDAAREEKRQSWRDHGASLVSDLESLVGKGDLDGVVVCAGKNGDDLPLVSELIRRLRAVAPSQTRPFLLHLSTLSNSFVIAATEYAAENGVDYVNYPLTGGPRGAELGGADPQGMLILAGGNTELFEKLTPTLSRLGHPKYFGKQATAGTTVKLIGHLMVFNGCVAIASAAALYAEDFCQGVLAGEKQSEFFEYLNRGAGGTRQWDVALSKGIRQGIWDQGFLVKHAVVDALYAADAAREAGLSRLAISPMFNLALGFSFLLTTYPNPEPATHALAKILHGEDANALDRFLLETSLPESDFDECIARIEQTLPTAVRQSVALRVRKDDFCAA